MKEEYQNELGQIHAPKELVKKTKKAMIPSPKRDYRWVGVVATLVVLFVSGIIIVLKNQVVEAKKPIQLGTTAENIMVDIEMQEEMVFDNLTIKLTDMTEKEIQGDNVVLQTVNGMQVMVYTNLINGYYQCLVEIGGQNYIISSKMTERDLFVNEVKRYLEQLD